MCQMPMTNSSHQQLLQDNLATTNALRADPFRGRSVTVDPTAVNNVNHDYQ